MILESSFVLTREQELQTKHTTLEVIKKFRACAVFEVSFVSVVKALDTVPLSPLNTYVISPAGQRMLRHAAARFLKSKQDDVDSVDVLLCQCSNIGGKDQPTYCSSAATEC